MVFSVNFLTCEVVARIGLLTPLEHRDLPFLFLFLCNMDV
jgi:hypothetical protein